SWLRPRQRLHRVSKNITLLDRELCLSLHQAVRCHVRFGSEADILRCGSEWRYSITSSARPSNDGGIERPSVFAVLRLTVSANLVGACAGKSAGFAPLRILSTYSAARRNWSFQSRLYDSSPPAVTASLSA